VPAVTSLDVELEARLRVLRKEERSGTSRYRIKPDLLINCAAILISGLISCAAILVSTGDMGEQIRVNSYQAESDNLAKLDDLKAYTHSLQ
jgi:hypothetical protein